MSNLQDIAANRKRIYIWGDQIPGNHPDSKRDIMDWHEEYTQEDLFTKYPGIWDKSTKELGDLTGNDTMVYRQEIQNGFAKETYEDQPFLIPYLCEESSRAVIICPGGAYLTKSMDSEGEDVALYLNEQGISAFVLWYRSYPYHMPLPYMDLQRAVRYLRFHASEYHIDPDKIAAVGFSAGGNLAAVTSLVLKNKPVIWEGYRPDEIDAVDGRINACGLIYAAISMEGDKIVGVIGGREIYEDPDKRAAFAECYDPISHLEEGDCPLFLAAAQDDAVVPVQFNEKLYEKAQQKNVSCEMHIYPYGGHGFGACVHEQMPMFWSDWTEVRKWKAQFADWIIRTL